MLLYFISSGTVFRGLQGKTVYPMLCSTAARTGMRLIKSCSFSTSLQFLSCQVLRKIIPANLDVSEALSLPPGLHAFLANNLSWLLRPDELQQQPETISSNRKRKRRTAASATVTESEDSGNEADHKRVRVASWDSDSVSGDDGDEDEPHESCRL